MNAPSCSKADLKIEKLQLEIDILKLEKQELEEKESPLGKKWQLASTLLGFLGWVVAALSLLVSVNQFNEKQDEALKQRKQAQTEAALARIQEDPLRVVLYLEDYSEQAIPLLVEMVHVRHEEQNWPRKTLRALQSLEDIDANLEENYVEHLRQEARHGWVKLKDWIGAKPAERPEKLMTSMDEIVFRIYELVGISYAVDEDLAWKNYSEEGRLNSVPDFGTAQEHPNT